jgi:hypothetical protein
MVMRPILKNAKQPMMMWWQKEYTGEAKNGKTQKIERSANNKKG